MKKVIVLSTFLIATFLNMVSLSAITTPTKAEADAYYKKWKSGDGSNKPGHVVEFKLPETVWLSRKAMYDSDSDKGSEAYPNVKDKYDGSKDGAVVYMVGNGNAEEFAPGQELSVSTDEAMGYGMMLAVLADDQELFNKFARVVEYYETVDEKYNHLTSWTIPAKSDGYFPGYTAIKTKVDGYVADGWSYNLGKAWEGGPDKQPYHDWWAPKKPKLEGGKIVGQKLDKYMSDPDKAIGPDNPASTATVSGIAMDGALDIAFAFLMAWEKWIDSSDVKQGDIDYLGIACRRFTQIIQVCRDYGRKDGATQHDDIEVLPLGNYNNRDTKDGAANGLTRPSDWLVANLRSYYECLQGEDTRKLIGTLIDQMGHFSDEDTNTFNPGVGPSHTGLVPDFCEQKGNQLDVIYTLTKPDGNGGTKKMVDEADVTRFSINAARVPFRQAMDYILYGDELTLKRAEGILDFIFKVPDTVQDEVEDDPETDPFAACFELNGNRTDKFYTNQVLKAAVMTAIYASNKSGESKYDTFYETYIGSFGYFDSQYSTWEDNQKWTRTKGSETKTDTFEFKKDPAHSGYFEDSWTAMALYAMSGSWEAPHPWPNEFDDPNTKFKIAESSKDYATLTKITDGFVIEITNDPGSNKVVFEVEDFESLTKSGFSLMAAIKRENGNGTSNIKAKMYYKQNPGESVDSKGEITITQDDITRGYMDGFANVNDKKEYKPGKIEFTLNSEGTGLKKYTKFTFTKMGIYDPDVEKARYRYVDNWRSDEPYYWVGDYVRHNLETWVCIKDHRTTRSSVPGYAKDLWEISDYTLLGERWESGRYYLDADLVYYQGKTYIARVPFTSIAPPPQDLTNWMLYYDHNEGIATNWFNKGSYLVGDLVHYEGNIYKCKNPHTANSSWNPKAAFTLWENVNNLFSDITPFPWEEWVSYVIGSVVMYNGLEYVCVMAHTSQPDWKPGDIATLWREK